jgi:hypothetical protein
MSFKLTHDEFVHLTKQSEEAIKARVICDSINPDGVRLTTMEWTYPRFIHSEIMTHRQLSRNSASSRAIPIEAMLRRIETNPVFPLHWGKSQKGMQAEQELTFDEKLEAGGEWMEARKQAIVRLQALKHIGIHKQIGNRLVEPWMWITVIVSATNFENLFALRCHKDAEPHFQNLAYKVRDAYDASVPNQLEWGQWHLPLFGPHCGDPDNDWTFYTGDDRMNWPKISAGRCARVSYLTHEGKRDPEEDLKLCERLATHKPMHASPLEHPAQAVNPLAWQSKIEGPRQDWGNFTPGWLQLRKMYQNECVRERQNVTT